jgi:beta-fructofuranosidase
LTTKTDLRPRVHLTPASGWLNDPHGLYLLDGMYHLFFQHVPDSVEWRADMHWGHATSTDLLHWQMEPVALTPGEGDDGCWSGCAVIGEDGQPVLFYTSAQGPDHQLGRIRVARLAQSNTHWVKGEVVATAMKPTIRVFRDPVVFRDGDRWRMVVGAGTTDGTAGAEVFSSDGLGSWRYDGTLTTRNTRSQHPWTGTGWECPQVVRKTGGDGGDVLVVSIWDDHTPHDVAGATGSYADGRFTVGRWRLLSAGQGHFAASSFTDADGRSCLIFWIRGIADPGRWSGAISIPYVVATDDDEIRLTPHPAVAEARVAADGKPGTALDVEWRLGTGGRLALEGADGRDRALLEAADGRVTVTVSGGAAPVEVAHTGQSLRLISDAQVLEVMADGGLVGLPLEATEAGLLPRTDNPDHVAWWHLT